MDGSNNGAPDRFEKGGLPGPAVVGGLLLISVVVVLLIYAMLR
jgi:hypothetical protein